MGVAAILVMWPGPFEQTFVPASLGVSIWNLSLIGPVVSEEMFEYVDGQTTEDGRTDAGVTGILLAHPWAFGSGELIKGQFYKEIKYFFSNFYVKFHCKNYGSNNMTVLYPNPCHNQLFWKATVLYHTYLKFQMNRPDPQVIKLFLCSTQMSMKFQLLINTKIQTNKEVSCFKSLRWCILSCYSMLKCQQLLAF